jgi:integrase
VTDNQEEPMWQAEVLGDKTAKTLLYTLYFYNGKLFGMRSQEHRQLRLENITIENNTTIVYPENTSKMFRGGMADMKKR